MENLKLQQASVPQAIIYLLQGIGKNKEEIISFFKEKNAFIQEDVLDKEINSRNVFSDNMLHVRIEEYTLVFQLKKQSALFPTCFLTIRGRRRNM